MKCDSCKHRAVKVVPGTQRQVIARYKAAWDNCYKCAREALSDQARLEGLIVASAERCVINGESIPNHTAQLAYDKMEREAARISKRTAARIGKRAKP